MKIKLSVLLLSAILLTFNVASPIAAGTGYFETGGYWQPPAKPTNYNTSTHWANIAAADIDVVVGHRLGGSYGITMNKTDNESGIANSYANNVRLLCTDSGIYNFKSYTSADYSTLADRLAAYKNDYRVAGLALRDEPKSWELEGIANSYRHAKAVAPDLDFYVNFCYIDNSRPGKLVLSNSGARGNGSYVRPNNSLGQVFRVPSGVTFIDGIDMYIDAAQWSSSETLTLRLWNSTAKTTLLGQASITGKSSTKEPDKYPYFRINAAVTPGVTYYMELTHNGGGDKSVGWVVRSDGNVYPDGSAYENGTARNYDFCFRLYTVRDNIGSEFENNLDDWVNISGADYILYDAYPFYGTSDNAYYFAMAEEVRCRGLANDVVYGGFLQSCEIYNSEDELSYRDPDMNMMRYNVYTFLAYGFKLMHWFTYWRPDNTGGYGETFYNTPVDYNGTLLTKYSQIRTLNAEMKNLSNTLKNLTSRRVYHTGASIPIGTTLLPANFFLKPANYNDPLVIGYLTDPNGRSYIMITNRDYINSRTSSFIFFNKPSEIKEISKSTGGEVSVPGYNSSTGALSVALQPGEGRLFALPSGFNPYVNLAASAVVTASSSYESTRDGWGIKKVNDDLRNSINRANGWSSNSNTGVNHTESITFDLGSNKTISEVDLFPRNDSGNIGQGFPIDFNIRVSTDNVNWTTVISRTGYPWVGNIGQFFSFSPATARYVRIEGTNLRTVTTEPGDPYRMQFAEVEIYSSADQSMGAVVSATSTVENSDWGIGKIKDRIKNSAPGYLGWTSNNNLSSNHTESISFDMQSNKTISRVDLYARNDYGNVGQGFPIDFTIKVSADNVNWTTVAARTGYPQPDHQVQSFTFTPCTARYVKVEGTNLRRITNESGQPYRMQFSEVEIY